MRWMLAVVAALVVSGVPVLAGERAVRADVLVEAGRAEVWRAWTTAEGWKEFFGADARIELKPGGAYEVYFVPDAPEGSRGSEGCTVLSYEPERMLSFSWGAPAKMARLREARGQIVVVTLTEEGANRTRVRLTHHHWPEGSAEQGEVEAARAYFEEAWPKVLGAMREHFEKAGKGAPAAAWGAPLKQFEYLITLANPEMMKTGGTAEEREALAGHVRYVNALHAQGMVLFAGRPMDAANSPGVVVFLAQDAEEAKRVMEEDPAVAAGVFRAEVHPYKAILQHTP
ncbi:MAG: SRPBCC domain-containing protein [Phycisphaerales bacterium]